MTNDEKLMQQALEALEDVDAVPYERVHAIVDALRERLAQKDEPNAEPIQPNEVLFAVEIPEGYEETHLELLGEDVFAGKQWVRWRVVPTDEPSTEPVAYRLHKTDIYDFAGWLTTRPGVMPVGSCSNAAPVADAVDEYIRKFPERFTAPPPRTPLTDEEINDEMDRLLLSPVEQEAFGAGVRYAERAHGIGEKK